MDKKRDSHTQRKTQADLEESIYKSATVWRKAYAGELFVETPTTGNAVGEDPILPQAWIELGKRLFAAKTKKQAHPDLVKRIVGEERHDVLVRAEERQEAQSQSAKDSAALRVAATDAIAREVQAAAERLRDAGHEEHEISGMLARYMWGEDNRAFGSAWVRKLLRRKVRPR